MAQDDGNFLIKSVNADHVKEETWMVWLDDLLLGTPESAALATAGISASSLTYFLKLSAQ